MLGLFKLIAAAALALVLWLAISGSLIVPFASPQEPPRPPEPIPALASATGAPTAPDIAKLNDTIAKLAAAVDKLNQQLAERDPAVKPSGSSSRPSSDTPRRQEMDARQTWRRSSWREPMCWW
jgi:hypothetical protein